MKKPPTFIVLDLASRPAPGRQVRRVAPGREEHGARGEITDVMDPAEIPGKTTWHCLVRWGKSAPKLEVVWA